MKLAVVGLWHLGSVVSACMAKLGIETLAICDSSDELIGYQQGRAPVFEPGLNELIQAGLASSKLRFSEELRDLAEAKTLWICYDTPVDDDDRADVDFVMEKCLKALEHLKDHSKIIISSQLPVQSAARLQALAKERFPKKTFYWAVSPENLRLGNALDVFLNPDRIIVGAKEEDRECFSPLFETISEKIEWMGVESAEMTKHGINSFLATSVSFANELARLAVAVGADPMEVARGLKTEKRIGKYAYLRPGPAFSGGTLARDISFMQEKSTEFALKAELGAAVFSSNNYHKQWLRERLKEESSGSLKGVSIGVLGLTYKSGTDTLRRSAAIELIKWALAEGAKVFAFDPRVKVAPSDLNISLEASVAELLEKSELLVLGTEHDEFKALSEAEQKKLNSLPLLDPGQFLGPQTNNISFKKDVSHGK